VLLASATLAAHHSFAMYDRSITYVFTGVVERIIPDGAHMQIVFVPLNEERKALVRDADGKTATWLVEMGGSAQGAREGDLRKTERPPFDLASERDPELRFGGQIHAHQGLRPEVARAYENEPVVEIVEDPCLRVDEVLKEGTPDFTCSAYDNSSAPWGSTHEETWKIVKKHDFFSGMFIWTGWDYIGEPTPYPWPAISSYFGIIDLAGFPKDSFYMYQSEWTSKPVLHLLPHWNWKQGEMVDVWAYFNGDEVELFLNGKSLGTKRKTGDDLHVSWRVPFEPGVLKAVSRRNGKVELTKEVSTAGEAAKLVLVPDRKIIQADGTDLSFVTVKVVDKNGVVVPGADNLVNFTLSGPGFVAGVDNGSEISHESFKASHRKAFHGLAMAIVQSKGSAGAITLKATADGLAPASVTITAR